MDQKPPGPPQGRPQGSLLPPPPPPAPPPAPPPPPPPKQLHRGPGGGGAHQSQSRQHGPPDPPFPHHLHHPLPHHPSHMHHPQQPSATPPHRPPPLRDLSSYPICTILGWTPRTGPSRGPGPGEVLSRRDRDAQVQESFQMPVPPPPPPPAPPSISTSQPPPLMATPQKQQHSQDQQQLYPKKQQQPIQQGRVNEKQTIPEWNGATAPGGSSDFQTPAWLKGGYAPRSSAANSGNAIGSAGIGEDGLGSGGGTKGSSTPTVLFTKQGQEIWAKKRYDVILATVKGDDTIAELRAVIVDQLKVPALEKHRESLRRIRKEKWAARERARGTLADLNKLQRELTKTATHAAHVDAKIERLRSYSRYIENGWKDPEVEAKSPPGDEPMPDEAEAATVNGEATFKASVGGRNGTASRSVNTKVAASLEMEEAPQPVGPTRQEMPMDENGT